MIALCIILQSYICNCRVGATFRNQLTKSGLYARRVFVYDREESGRVVQWLERHTDNVEVGGSIPPPPTKSNICDMQNSRKGLALVWIYDIFLPFFSSFFISLSSFFTAFSATFRSP
jgi:hypothetical protein